PARWERHSARALTARRRMPAPVRALPVLPLGTGLGVHVGWQPLRYLFDMGFTRDAWAHRIDIARAAITEDDRIMTPGTWTGTQRAPFMGIPATGRTVTVESWTLDRYRDGRLAESRIIMDVAGMLMQLGLIPAPAA
ncbi:MAG TPA: ester cyclase, partial [Streptosporangiaceae bacterium]|nr:ester cyclase [Streptosporangiaceae bacterium]